MRADRERTMASDLLRAPRPVNSAGGTGPPGFREFYERTCRPLWAYMARASGRPDVADDLTQEAYYRLLRSGFVGTDDDHRRNYLYRIATHLLRDEERRARRAPAPAAEGDIPARPQGAAGLRHDLGRLLAQLQPRERRLLWLAHAEGRSHREIAGILGVRQASVRVLLFRARRKLAVLARRAGLTEEVRE